MNPIHNYFGFRMRANWKEPHHLYWGFLGVLLSLWGIHSCFVLNELTSGILAQFKWVAPMLIGIEVVAGWIWFYVFCDDVYQHHRQVKEPSYHSPVHNWYVKILTGNSRIIKLIRKINEWFDGGW